MGLELIQLRDLPDEDVRAHALAYAAAGVPVLPLHWWENGCCSCGSNGCKSPAKHPLTLHGLKDAATNVNVVERWWDRWPDANVGIATGEAAGAWVLDIDGAEGSASLTQLENEVGGLPNTSEVATGGGGRHLFFAWEPNRPIRNKQSLRPGVDVRGEGGYVVAPPSIHASGRRYMWI